jgi:hypothetical protein
MSLPEPNAIEQPRSVSQIIGEALDIYQRYPIIFLTLALAVIAPYELIVLAATGTGPLASSVHQSLLQYYLLLVVDSVVVSPLVSVLHIQAVLRIGEGERPRLGQVALRGLQVLPVAVAAVIVAGAGTLLGFIALIIPGILLTIRWAVVAQVAAIEHEGWIPSLRRSAELTRNHYGHVFGLLFLVGVVTIGVMAGARALPPGSTSGVASVAVGIAFRTITASFGALTSAILYFDLNARLRPGPPQIVEHQHLHDLDPSPSEEDD